jgi:hypothetical protein
MLNYLGVSSSYPKPQIRMKLKFILFIVLTSLSIIEVKAQNPVLPNFLVPETLNPAFGNFNNRIYWTYSPVSMAK